MKASDLFVRCLEAEGAKFVFGIPGEENLDFLESLRNSKIQLILTRHEQAAGFMAATVGRLTGNAGVCLSTLGPGATNFVTAAAYAQLGAMPMVMLTGQKPVKTSKQGHFQIVNVIAMMRPLTKGTWSIVSGDSIPARVREAFRKADEERPGATHIELPEDVAAELTSAKPFKKSYVRRPIAEDKSIAVAGQAIAKAKRPLLMIGAGANRKTTAKMLREFLGRHPIPFFSTQMGKGVVDEVHELYMGCAALSDADFLHRAIDHADLIINVGHDVVEKPPFFMRSAQKQVIHINFNSAEVDPVYFPQTEVIGDIANSLWRLRDAIPDDHKPWDLGFFHNVKEHLDAHIKQDAEDPRFPIYPQRMVADVRKAMPDDGIVCLDNGVYKIWFARNYRARLPNTLLLDNALATMGAGLPSAIAAKLVHPARKVMAVCGDGGFMMNSQEIETAVRLKLDLTVLILNDSAYGMIKWKQTNMGFANYGLDYGNPDFVRYAEAYGAKGHRPQSAEELLPLLQRCQQEPGVHVIDLAVDYSDNDRVLNQEIRELSAQI
ncbi:MAG: acetolactate synthase large subunit [Pseudomonadota bacterium]